MKKISLLLSVLFINVILYSQENNNSEESYDKYISIADSMFLIKDLKKSLEFYEKASYIFPNAQYPKDQISILTKSIVKWTSIDDNSPKIIFEGKVRNSDGENIKDVVVNVKRNNYSINQIVTSIEGKYEFNSLPFGHNYTIIFSKDKYVSKSILVDTEKNYLKDSIEPNTYLDIGVTLFEKENDIDYSKIENVPVAKARIDPISCKLDWDYVYINDRKKESDKILKNSKINR